MLRYVKIGGIALLLGAAALLLASQYILAVLLLAAYFFTYYKFFRCPHCGELLENRKKVGKGQLCPFCGQPLSGEKLPEEAAKEENVSHDA